MYDKEKPGEDGNPQPGNDKNLQDQNNEWITEDQATFDGDPETEFCNAIKAAGLLPPSTGFNGNGKPQAFDGIMPGQYDCEYRFDGTTGSFKTPDDKKWSWKIGGLAKRAETTPPSALSIRCMADIEAKPIDWFWPGKIARGKATMIAGNPGLGKSQLALWLAAKTSSGSKWPNDDGMAPMGGVLIISGEDAAADTIKPRLMAVGANLEIINIVDGVRNSNGSLRGFDLSQDIDFLGQLMAKLGNTTLVIIDPVSAYLGGTDSHKNADVRALLSPLSSLAEKHNAAIVLVSHLNKSGGEAVSRITGSGAFVAASRATFIVANEIIEGKDTGRRLFMPAKNNLGPDNSGLAFTVKSHQLENGIETSRIVWQSGTIDKSADEVLAAIHTITPNDAPKRNEAKNFLCEVLSDGPLPAKEIKRQANEAGITWRTVERAKTKLLVTTTRNGFGKDAFYEWSLPNTKAENTIDRHTCENGGPCNDTPHNSPKQGPLPIDRQMAGEDSLAAYGNGDATPGNK